ncbi:MAG: cyclomaltodextrinase C-terminal domain-containing protein, partial [Pseudoalteromonas shioyasakiensis]
MDFSLQEALIQALNEEESWNTGWVKVYQSLANDFLYADTDNILVFADNHDMSRVYTELGQDLAKTKLAMTLLLTTRGIPQIYYGTELLLDNTPSNDHGDIRIDFPGGFKGQKANAFTGKGLSADQQEMLASMKKLLKLRQEKPALSEGRLMHFSPKQGVYSYVREHNGQTVLVVLNKNQQAIDWDLSYMQEVLKGNNKGRDLISEKRVDLAAPIRLKAMQARLIELE